MGFQKQSKNLTLFAQLKMASFGYEASYMFGTSMARRLMALYESVHDMGSALCVSGDNTSSQMDNSIWQLYDSQLRGLDSMCLQFGQFSNSSPDNSISTTTNWHATGGDRVQ